MTRDAILATLRAHEPELKASGVVSLSVFGSVARGDERPDSDVDVVVRLTEDAAQEGFDWFGRIDAITHRIQGILGRPADVVTEPAHKGRFRRAIDKEQAHAFWKADRPSAGYS